MKPYKLILLFTITSLNCLSQDLDFELVGDSIQCVDSEVSLEVKIENSKDIRFSWIIDDDQISEEGAKLIDKDLSKSGTKKYTCRIFKKLTSTNDTLLAELTKEVEIKAKPKLLINPTSTVSDNDIVLTATANDRYFQYEWTSPSKEKYFTQVVTLKNVNLGQLGIYSLLVTDSRSECSSEYKLDIEAENKAPKQPNNVFGTIDEIGEYSDLMKITTRDFPIYECNILGEKTEEKFIISYLGVTWQVIGEIGSKLIIVYIPHYDDYYAYEANLSELQLAIEDDKDIIQELKESSRRASGNYKQDLDKDISRISRRIMKSREEIRKLKSDSKYLDYFRYYTDITFTKEKYFLVERTDFEARTRNYRYKSKPFRPGFTAGTVLIPVKIRFNKFEFSKDVTLGPFIGMKWLISSYRPNYFSLGLTAGISSVRLSERNTNSSLVEDVIDVAAFSYSLGGILEFNNVQVGVFVGKDAINNNRDQNNQIGYNWSYQEKWWISIGLGYSIISRPSQRDQKLPRN